MINLKERQLEGIIKLSKLIEKERFISDGDTLASEFMKELLVKEEGLRTPNNARWISDNKVKIKLVENEDYRCITKETCDEFYKLNFKEKNFNEYYKLVGNFIENIKQYVNSFKKDENIEIINKIQDNLEREYEEVTMLEQSAFDYGLNNHYRCLNQTSIKLGGLLQDFYSFYGKKHESSVKKAYFDCYRDGNITIFSYNGIHKIIGNFTEIANHIDNCILGGDKSVKIYGDSYGIGIGLADALNKLGYKVLNTLITNTDYIKMEIKNGKLTRKMTTRIEDRYKK